MLLGTFEHPAFIAKLDFVRKLVTPMFGLLPMEERNVSGVTRYYRIEKSCRASTPTCFFQLRGDRTEASCRMPVTRTEKGLEKLFQPHLSRNARIY